VRAAPSGPDPAPRLIVVIDTEEEFDWTAPFSRSATGVTAMSRQAPAQRLLAARGVVPTYAVDWPVASQRDGFAPLLEWLHDGTCEIGAHLHPWVNPPDEEPVSDRNSFPGNLPASLERAKLQALTERIESNFGVRPRTYRAGRYGLGPNTASLLDEFGFEVDVSVVPYTDMRAKHGPDFRHFRPLPYWFGPEGRLLEIPLTTGLIGWLGAQGPLLQDLAEHRLGRTLRAGAVLARSGALMRVRLTPEGVPIEEAIAATRYLFDAGLRVFLMSWHSPSLAPGNTPYVRNERELTVFLDWIRRYLDFFFDELGGRAATPTGLRHSLLGAGAQAGAVAA
jgi:hypothetical protein